MTHAPRVRTCAPCNPANAKKGLQIVSPTPQMPVQAYIVSDELLGVLTHFEQPGPTTNGRTRPCMGDGTCRFCQEGIAARWKGFVIGQGTQTGRLFIVELTENAAMSCYSTLTSPEGIRGKVITLKRAGKSRNSAVQAVITPGDRRIALPDSFDLLPHLFRLWGLQQDGSFVHRDRKRRRSMREERDELAARGHLAGYIPYDEEGERR